MQNSGFTCTQCGKFVPENLEMGTKNRNHCPYCLYSRHVDEKVGDRKAACMGNMQPIGLTFKKKKYGKGELMLIHMCKNCGKVSINRVAADDAIHEIHQVFQTSLTLSDTIKNELEDQEIHIAQEKDREEIQTQLFGKKST